MTEAEWMASDDPAAMVVALRKQDDRAGRGHDISDRKLRLWIAACREAVERARPNNYAWHNLGSSDGLQSVLQWWVGAGVAEDAPAYVDDLSLAARCHLLRDIVGSPFRPVVLPPGPRECDRCSGYGWVQRGERLKCPDCRGAGKTLCPWLTPTVLSLAQAAYDERQPDGTLDTFRLSLLADELELMGCNNDDMLLHLRGFKRCQTCLPFRALLGTAQQAAAHAGNGGKATATGRVDCSECVDGWQPCGPHVRGCHVVDLLTGRE